MEILKLEELDNLAFKQALTRPAIMQSTKVMLIVKDIIEDIKNNGDVALKKYSKELDKFDGDNIKVSEEQIQKACDNLDPKLKKAIDNAYKNIKHFHKAQKRKKITVKTAKGIICEQRSHAIEAVGLYVPGGSAPLVSTALMLAVPAKIARCEQIILCSPPPINDAILYAASKAGIKDIYNLGGAQAIAAMAYGTQTVPKVLKIFGPGNQYVTMAKRLVSDDNLGAAIDMPAGPSEVLVIADKHAKASYIASDLLSQAEHGNDSQVILLSDSLSLIEQVNEQLNSQLAALPRKEIATVALSHSRAILCKDLALCCKISNEYAPEHLILHVTNAKKLLPNLKNAGSIFVGAYTPESLGDYASGTNHTLPTYGYAKTASALGLDDFKRRYTVQYASKAGLKALSKTVETLADAESLFAHKNAVSIRTKD